MNSEDKDGKRLGGLEAVEVPVGSSLTDVSAGVAQWVGGVAHQLSPQIPGVKKVRRLGEKFRLRLLAPDEVPRRFGEEIVWLAKNGPRSHRLNVPEREEGGRVWSQLRCSSADGEFVTTVVELEASHLARWSAPSLKVVSAKAEELPAAVEGHDAAAVVLGVAALAGVRSGETWPPSSRANFEKAGGIVCVYLDSLGDLERLPEELSWLGASVRVLVSGPEHEQLLQCVKARVPVGSLGALPVPVADAAQVEPGLVGVIPGKGDGVLGQLSRNSGHDQRFEPLRGRGHRVGHPGVVVVNDESGGDRGSDYELALSVLTPNSALCVSEALNSSDHALWANLEPEVYQGGAQLKELLEQWQECPSLRLRSAYRTWRARCESDSFTKRFALHTGLPIGSSPLKKVSVICVSQRPQTFAQVLKTYRQQTYLNKELILVANCDEVPESVQDAVFNAGVDVRFLRTPDSLSLGASLNRGRVMATGEVWTKMDDDDFYAPNYLRGLMLGMESSGADVVGKGTFFTYLEEEDQLLLNSLSPDNQRSDRFLHGGTICADRKKTEGIPFLPVVQGTDSLFLQHCKLAGLHIHSCDRFNFAYIRYAQSGHHTHSISSKAYAKNLKPVCQGLDKSIIVV